jgi:hypothetical protein
MDEYSDIKNMDDSITTDQSLYNIMSKKQRLSSMFLDSLKEASIDCLVHYEHKDKCLRFPVSIPKDRLISDVDYTQAPTQTYTKKEVETEKRLIILKNLKVDGRTEPFAVDMAAKVAYDLDIYKSEKRLQRIGTFTASGHLKID